MTVRFLRIDWAIVIPAIGLVSAGILMLSTTAAPDEQGLASNAVQQGIFASVGLAGAIAIALMDYRGLRYLAVPLFVIGNGALAAVLLLGDDSYGARRWFEVGPIVVQPSEIMKLLAIVFLAHYLARRRERVRSLRTVGASLGLILIPVGLIFLEPDLGTALMFVAVWAAMLFVAGARWWHLLAPAGIALAVFPFGWFFAQDYMRERFVTFFDPASDPLGAGYNVLQARISIGSGGWWGQGIGQGTQTQLEFLRVRDTDFIFAVLGEQLGFVGAIGVILFFTILIVQAVVIAVRARDDFGRYIAVGVAVTLFVQSFINIGMNIGLMPITGLTLPLVSYGRNSLVVTLLMLGVLLSVGSLHRDAGGGRRPMRWVSAGVARPGRVELPR